MCLSGAGGASGGFERHKRRTPPSHCRNAANCVFRPMSSSLQRPVMLMDFLKCHCSLTQSHESTSPSLSARLNGQKTRDCFHQRENVSALHGTQSNTLALFSIESLSTVLMQCRAHLLRHHDWWIIHNTCMPLVKVLFSHYIHNNRTMKKQLVVLAQHHFQLINGIFLPYKCKLLKTSAGF